MNPALRTEWRKLHRSPVGRLTALALTLGLVAILGGVTAAVDSGDPALLAQAGPLARQDWDGLLAGSAQILGAAGVLAAGTLLSWCTGREFADGTVAGLFAQPVGRGRIAAAKLLVTGLWLLGTAVVAVAAVTALGLALGYGRPGATDVAQLLRLAALVVLSGVVALPAALVATLTRSVLAGVGTGIGLVVLAQVGALGGLGAWMPFAAPALWAMSGGAAAGAPHLALTLGVGALAAALTVGAWSRLQLAR